MRAVLPETTITKTGVQQINVGEVKVGPISIARLVLSDLHVESSTGVARLRNVIYHDHAPIFFGLEGGGDD